MWLEPLIDVDTGEFPWDRQNDLIISCIEDNRFEMLKQLLKSSHVDPTFNNNKPIRYAAKHGHTEIVKLLLAHPDVDPSASAEPFLENGSDSEADYDESDDYFEDRHRKCDGFDSSNFIELTIVVIVE